MFSDESHLQHYVRRPPGKRYDEKYIIKNNEKLSQPDEFGTADLHFLDPGTIMNGQKYQELMQDE